MEVLIDTKPKEHILNVGNVSSVSIRDWVTLCYACLDRQPEFVNVSPKIEQRNYFSFYHYEYYLDVKKQQSIYPETISLREGLQEAAEWYLSHETEVNRKAYLEYIDQNLA